MLFKKTLLTAALLAFGGFAMTASAATQPTSFNVTATVINNCKLVTSSNIAFPNYDPTSATGVTAAGAVTAKCTKGDVVSVGLDQGLYPQTGSTTAVPVRAMKDAAGDLLPYHIYIASTGTVEWGTGTVGTNEPGSQASASVGTALSFPTNGAILAGVDVPAATTYSDTVTATVTY